MDYICSLPLAATCLQLRNAGDANEFINSIHNSKTNQLQWTGEWFPVVIPPILRRGIRWYPQLAREKPTNSTF